MADPNGSSFPPEAVPASPGHPATFAEYEREALPFASYPGRHENHPLNLIYPALGLAGEAGEVVEKVKKAWRADYRTGSVPGPVDRLSLAAEMGDVLWYLAALADALGLSLADIAAMNIQKLQDRDARGVLLTGEGDKR